MGRAGRGRAAGRNPLSECLGVLGLLAMIFVGCSSLDERGDGSRPLDGSGDRPDEHAASVPVADELVLDWDSSTWSHREFDPQREEFRFGLVGLCVIRHDGTVADRVMVVLEWGRSAWEESIRRGNAGELRPRLSVFNYAWVDSRPVAHEMLAMSAEWSLSEIKDALATGSLRFSSSDNRVCLKEAACERLSSTVDRIYDLWTRDSLRRDAR